MKTILVISFILYKAMDWVLEILDTIQMGKPLPENVRDVYDAQAYQKWIDYHRENKRLRNWESILTLVTGVLMLAFPYYAFVFGLFKDSPIYLQYFLAILAFTTVDNLLSLPFGYYDTFVIEERYGMNRTTKKTFWLDTFKSWAISAVLEFALVAMIMFLYERFGDPGIALICLAVIAISLLVNLIVVPLMRVFNRFDPLEDGQLKEDLLNLCAKYGVTVKKIVVRDASRRTTRANAFCTGFTKKKTISLDDNLVKDYSNDQIVAVFAHEFAHARYNHILKSLPFSLAQTVLTIVMLGVVFHITPAFEAFGFEGVNYFFSMTLLPLFTWPLMRLLEYIDNLISRKHEYEADAFAAREGYGEALISSLKKLSGDSLSNLNPHPFIVKLHHSHPTLSQRIDAIHVAACG